MIAIVAAMAEEIAEIKQLILINKEYKKANCLIFEGNLHDKEVILMQTGIGKVNAAMAMTLLLDSYDIDLVINIGSAGGLKTDCAVGDIVIANETIYHDVDAVTFGYEYGQVPGMPLSYKGDTELISICENILKEIDLNFHVGVIGTGDSFIGSEIQLNKIRKDLPHLIAVEMEACAFAQVCYQYQKPFLILRSLSDIAGKESTMLFTDFLKVAVANSTKIVNALVEKI